MAVSREADGGPKTISNSKNLLPQNGPVGSTVQGWEIGRVNTQIKTIFEKTVLLISSKLVGTTTYYFFAT